MQSVPSEFVTQLRPLMFVAGLGNEQQQEPAASADSLESPSAFIQLVQSLRQVLVAKRAFQLYDPPAGKITLNFQVSLVDKNVRFPPRKARLSTGQIGNHSPISPFSATSPLYPDGIMHPTWIRKHRELLPSVFVLVLRLYEFGLSNTEGTGPSLDEVDVGPLDKEKVEKLRDNELVNEIVSRKRSCAERGIKLAVVLLTSREMLDDPALDPRLSHIRRLSTLDSRASLFVLSPVPTSEVQNFVSSLKAELAESALDYYREHGRRLRRKRSRPANHTPTASAILTNDGTAAEAVQSRSTPPITPQALNVRYEYKAAVFAEFRGEVEVALKHYEDCYYALADLFTQNSASGSPQLQARTKRWAEAKVLIDCIVVKICKLYMYSGNSPYALASYRHHVKRFASISQESWKIGEESYEYWSWASKQHRMFGDLLEAAIKAGYQLPALPRPTPGPPLHARAAAQHVPDSILQHPGYYYYLAGLCAVRRRDCFKEAELAFKKQEAEKPIKASTALVHERAVPHAEQIVELFSKAYEYFKREKATRVTLYLADQISAVHCDTGNAEMAQKFDDRIGRTYRREGWTKVLDSMLSRTIEKPRQQHEGPDAEAGRETAGEDRQAICRKYLERLALHGIQIDPSSARLEELWTALLHRLPSDQASEPVTLASETCLLPVSWQCFFWQTAADLEHTVPYQVQIRSAALQCTSDSQEIAVMSISLCWTDQRPWTTVESDNSADVAIISIDTAGNGAKGNLTFVDGIVTIQGLANSENAQDLALDHVELSLRIGQQPLSLRIGPVTKPVSGAKWATSEGARDSWLSLSGKADRSFCRFQPRKLAIDVQVSSPAPAFLNEPFPITLTVTNNDTVDTRISLDAVLQPAAGLSEAAEPDAIRVEPATEAQQSISGHVISESLKAGSKQAFRLFLQPRQVPGPRVIDLSIICKPPSSGGAQSRIATAEIAKRVNVDVVHPFFCDFRAEWSRRSIKEAGELPSIVDLEKPDPWAGSLELLLDITTGGLGPADVSVDGIVLELAAPDRSRVLYRSLEAEDGQLPDVWKPEEPFALLYEVEIQRQHVPEIASSLGHLDIHWHRPSSDSAAPNLKATTRIPTLPLTLPSVLAEGARAAPPIVECRYDSKVRLHEPFSISYHLVLPAHTAAPRLISYTMESAPNNFVFTGPRKTDRCLILPDSARPTELIASFTMIPIGETGFVDLPAFKVWEIMETPAQEEERRRTRAAQEQATGIEIPDEGPPMRALRVERAGNPIVDTEEGAELPPHAAQVYVLPR